MNEILFEILYGFYASFSVYVFHQQWVVITAFFTLKITNVIPLQVLGIIIVSFLFTIMQYEWFKRMAITKVMFGIKGRV